MDHDFTNEPERWDVFRRIARVSERTEPEFRFDTVFGEHSGAPIKSTTFFIQAQNVQAAMQRAREILHDPEADPQQRSTAKTLLFMENYGRQPGDIDEVRIVPTPYNPKFQALTPEHLRKVFRKENP